MAISLKNFASMDPFILYSAVNMQLRDAYSSLEDLCKANEISAAELQEKLKQAGFTYQKEQNQFK